MGQPALSYCCSFEGFRQAPFCAAFLSVEYLWEVAFSSSGIYCRWERQHAAKGLSPSPLYIDSITVAPEVPAIRGSGDETQAEISIRQWGLETGPYSLVSFHNLSDRDEPLRCILMLHISNESSYVAS